MNNINTNTNQYMDDMLLLDSDDDTTMMMNDDDAMNDDIVQKPTSLTTTTTTTTTPNRTITTTDDETTGDAKTNGTKTTTHYTTYPEGSPEKGRDFHHRIKGNTSYYAVNRNTSYGANTIAPHPQYQQYHHDKQKLNYDVTDEHQITLQLQHPKRQTHIDAMMKTITTHEYGKLLSFTPVSAKLNISTHHLDIHQLKHMGTITPQFSPTLPGERIKHSKHQLEKLKDAVYGGIADFISDKQITTRTIIIFHNSATFYVVYKTTHHDDKTYITSPLQPTIKKQPYNAKHTLMPIAVPTQHPTLAPPPGPMPLLRKPLARLGTQEGSSQPIRIVSVDGHEQ